MCGLQAMIDDSVPKADGIKQLRDGVGGGDTPLYTKSGDWPKRYKGYYRALKRKEEWALYLQGLPPLQHIMQWFYHDARKLVGYSDNPFLLLPEKLEIWTGKYYPVPINYGGIDDE